MARETLEEMARSLPDMSPQTLHQAFFFMVGVLISTCARPDRIETLSQGRHGSSDLRGLVDTLCGFVHGGFVACRFRDRLDV